MGFFIKISFSEVEMVALGYSVEQIARFVFDIIPPVGGSGIKNKICETK